MRSTGLLCNEIFSNPNQLSRAIYARLVPLPYRIRIRQRLQRKQGYQALPSVLEPIWVDPYVIRYRSIKRFIPEDYFLGRIINGDWDQQTEPIHKTATFRGLHEHFVNDIPWEETTYFTYAKKQIDLQGEFFGYTSSAEFLEKRCSYIDDLYISIKKEGLQKNPSDVPYDRMRPWSHYDPTEITVLITRDGQLILHDGAHRLTIAWILGLDVIPVNVLIRHERWQQVRDMIANKKNISKKYSTHPDLDEFSE